MDKNSPLGNQLKELGFFMAYGSYETIQFNKILVSYGPPNHWDVNNSTYVVVDQFGQPWVRGYPRDGSDFDSKVRALASEFNLSKGCYVPHSNDGGVFVRNELPLLVYV